jgi:sporulation protein YlmC with PRC-barrel domain
MDDASRSSRIVPLDEAADFRVAEGEPDIRGWDVLAADGRCVGRVENLLVDPSAMKVRYLDVEIDDDLLDTDRDRHVLIPIGYARLDRDENRIMVDQLNSSDVGVLPEYRSEPITRDYETTVRSSWDRGFESTGSPDSDFYDSLLYDDRRFYGTSVNNPLA